MMSGEVIRLLDDLKSRQKYKVAEVVCSQALQEIEKKSDMTKGDIPEARDTAKLYNERGHLHYKQVNFSEAIDDFTKALHLNPDFAAAYYNRGTIHYRLGRFQKAVEDMEKALNLEPENKEFALGLAESRNCLGTS